MSMFDDHQINRQDIRREWERKRSAFERLCVEPCMRTPKPGDRVVFAAGLIGHGFEWVRLEARVLEVGDTSVRVEFDDHYHCVEWIHPCLITDVLSQGTPNE